MSVSDAFEETTTGDDLDPGRVLVVDDAEVTADVLVRHLQLDGYDAYAITDPVEALEAITADPPDLVLLDVNMPRMNGMEVLQELRANPITREVPVIMVTASGETADMVRGFESGANDYITKPPQYEVLMVRVSTHMKIGRLQRQRLADLEALRQLNLLKDKFLQIAAHDLKNPLNNLSMGVSLIERMQEDAGLLENSGEIVQTMLASIRIMNSLVSDFLDFQAMRAGTIHLEMEDVSLNDLVQSAVNQHAANAAAKDVSLRANLSTDLPSIQADPDRVYQVISNLVSNAVKFSPAGAQVGVRTRANHEMVICEVADTGPGIPDEEMPLLFEEFARLSNKPIGHEKSSGLGLWISRQLVELHGGQIGAKSKVGQGSLFWFTLPAG
jgi:two-component system sensor histidine kinase/response regulator